jgi:hypothetical protein
VLAIGNPYTNLSVKAALQARVKAKAQIETESDETRVINPISPFKISS